MKVEKAPAEGRSVSLSERIRAINKSCDHAKRESRQPVLEPSGRESWSSLRLRLR